ncbi:Chromatin associated protein KTI12 [Serratia quinivorans]|nr:Chromatin associated protein KTI12 [Serratia quinivorans]CAI1100092.1 Chromatin associated protein KTI12 [Serratia quinivorans]CAI1153111.1 Chromatin associated protein KTI12 [Serratia quinivorans]CAI1619752.1 Chromatin associated protein KTI12 [Serratia quinivorans]CAI2037042.1 Chromatin associated protein KTI12 [Serratia quinivorans]
MLIVFSGLPGSGKTTLARALASALAAMHLRIDTLEQAIRNSGSLANDIGPAGYFAAYGVAEDNLRLGHTVIADSVNPLPVTREDWHSVALRAGTAWILKWSVLTALNTADESKPATVILPGYGCPIGKMSPPMITRPGAHRW